MAVHGLWRTSSSPLCVVHSPSRHARPWGMPSAAVARTGSEPGGRGVVVVPVAQHRGGSLVEQRGRVGVPLEHRGRARGRQRTLERGRHGRGLAGSGGDEHEASRVEDGAESLGDAMGRHVRDPVEEACVVVARAVGQPLDARSRRERRAGLVEAEVTVGTDAEDLHVDPTRNTDESLVLRGTGDELVLVMAGAVGHLEPVGRQPQGPADLAEQHLAVRLGVTGGQADVLVEREATGAAQVETTGRHGPRELRVEPQGRRPGREPEDWLVAACGPEAVDDDLGRPAGDVGGRGQDEDLHHPTLSPGTVTAASPTGEPTEASRGARERSGADSHAAPRAATGTSAGNSSTLSGRPRASIIRELRARRSRSARIPSRSGAPNPARPPPTTTRSAPEARASSWTASPTPVQSTSTAAAARASPAAAAANGFVARRPATGQRRASAEPEATVSRQPTWPHVHGASPPTGRCPISPAAPSIPRTTTPSRTTAEASPVPRLRYASARPPGPAGPPGPPG